MESGLDDDHLPLHLVFDGNVDAAAMVARRNDFVHLPENGGNDIFGEDLPRPSLTTADIFGRWEPLSSANTAQLTIPGSIPMQMTILRAHNLLAVGFI